MRVCLCVCVSVHSSLHAHMLWVQAQAKGMPANQKTQVGLQWIYAFKKAQTRQQAHFPLSSPAPIPFTYIN